MAEIIVLSANLSPISPLTKVILTGRPRFPVVKVSQNSPQRSPGIFLVSMIGSSPHFINLIVTWNSRYSVKPPVDPFTIRWDPLVGPDEIAFLPIRPQLIIEGIDLEKQVLVRLSKVYL